MKISTVVKNFMNKDYDQFINWCVENAILNGNSSHGVTHVQYEIVVGIHTLVATARHTAHGLYGNWEVDMEKNKSLCLRDDGHVFVKKSQGILDWTSVEDEEGVLEQDPDSLLYGV